MPVESEGKVRLRRKKRSADQPRRRQRDSGQDNDIRRLSVGNVLFRRNRTLTGSLSANVSSAAELGGDLRSPRIHAHHLVAHRRRLGSILFVIVLIVLLLTWLIYEFTAVVHPIPVTSSIVIQAGRYEKVIDGYFAIHPIERLRFVLNEQQLNEYAKRQAPEIESIKVDGSAGFATSQFEIAMRQPLAGWLIGASQNYVDSNGVAFKINYYDEPSVKIVDQSGIPQTTGQAVASSRFLGFVGRSVATARQYGLTIEQAIIPSGTTRQVALKIAGHNYPIKLSLDRPVGEQIEDMQRAVTYFDGRGVSPQYIDVRVSGKAYYQ